MKEYLEKWRKKSFGAKLSDVFFVLFIVAMLIPAPRREILRFANYLRAKIVQPSVKNDNSVKLTDADYDWQLMDLSGKPFNVSDYKGKVIFINFWATWCGPCLGEMPEIQKLYDEYKNNSNVAFLLVSSEDLQTISSFKNRSKYSFPLYSAKYGTPQIFDFSSIPTSYIIDRNGRVVVRTVGAANWGGNKIKKLVDKLINQTN